MKSSIAENLICSANAPEISAGVISQMSFAAVLERLQKVVNPYPGLRHFETEESHLFFGRDRQIAELASRLERNRFVAVVGVSGSGKSSLVRAGLIPALERSRVGEARARWRMVVTQPRGGAI